MPARSQRTPFDESPSPDIEGLAHEFDVNQLRQHLAAYKEEYAVRGREIERLRRRISDLTAEDHGEVWFWDEDGDNDVDSLTCPVQIRAETLRRIIRTSDQLLNAVQLAYRKHSLDDESVGWNELGDRLVDALCEAMTDAGYQAWAKENVERIGRE